jgi:hypothetical protein
MRRRLWLALALGVPLVGLLAAGGYYWWMTRVRWAWMRPETSFEASARAPAPDYAERSAWAAHNDLRDPADLVPHGVPAAWQHAADVFSMLATSCHCGLALAAAPPPCTSIASPILPTPAHSAREITTSTISRCFI